MGAVFDRTTLFLAVLTGGLVYASYQKTGHLPWDAMGQAWGLFIGIVAKLVLGLVVGMVLTDVLPRSMIENWLSDRSGWRGMAIGWVVGGITPIGAPFVLLPMCAGLLKGGAGIGPLVCFLTASSLFGSFRILVYEVPIMGGGFFLLRLAVTFWMPVAAGWMAQQLSLRIQQ